MKGAMPLVSEALGHGGMIAHLSEELHVPAQEVEQVYHAQLERLRGTARVRNYLVMLAAGRTRSILWAATHQPHGMERTS